LSPDLTLILVTHHSSAELPAAIAAFRCQAAALSTSHEVVVVEQSEDPAEAERVSGCAPDRLLVLPNRGYAAGVNAGIAVARGRWLLAGNPDVELRPGALAPLLTALGEGWDVVAPQLELAGLLFPPADVPTPRAETARRLALRGRRAWERHLRRELQRWRAVWEAAGPHPVPGLSGALLAFPAALAARLGPWDEGFFLYFEETDWLRRARGAGALLAVVPAARATHRWGHAARPEEWTERFAASQRRYYRRWFPWLGPLALRLEAGGAPSARPWSEVPAGNGWRWLLSPAAAGFPAALLDSDQQVENAAAAFCTACRRERVTLLRWHPAEGSLAGPFGWEAAE